MTSLSIVLAFITWEDDLIKNKQTLRLITADQHAFEVGWEIVWFSSTIRTMARFIGGLYLTKKIYYDESKESIYQFNLFLHNIHGKYLRHILKFINFSCFAWRFLRLKNIVKNSEIMTVWPEDGQAKKLTDYLSENYVPVADYVKLQSQKLQKEAKNRMNQVNPDCKVLNKSIDEGIGTSTTKSSPRTVSGEGGRTHIELF